MLDRKPKSTCCESITKGRLHRSGYKTQDLVRWYVKFLYCPFRVVPIVPHFLIAPAKFRKRNIAPRLVEERDIVLSPINHIEIWPNDLSVVANLLLLEGSHGKVLLEGLCELWLLMGFWSLGACDSALIHRGNLSTQPVLSQLSKRADGNGM